MKILDPNLKDGIHEWRDGKRFVKEGEKLYLEGTDTLAGRYTSPSFPPGFEAHYPLVLLPWINASATSLVSRVALWARQSNAPHTTLQSTSYLIMRGPVQ
jgi:hypothetical protein